MGSLPGCLALERKHRVPKSFADPIKNTRNKMEITVLRAVSARHLSELKFGQHFQTKAGLVCII